MSTEIPARPTSDLGAVTTRTKDLVLSPLGVPQQLRHFGRADDHTFAYIPMPNPNLPVRTGDNVLAKLSTGLVARYSLVERAAGRPQLLGTLLQCCEWWYALGGSVQISIAIGENVATGRAIAAARVLLGLDQAALAGWRMFHRQRSQTLSGATVFATIRSTPFCPPFVAEARPSALIETVLLPLRSIFTSPHSERLARQHGNG